MSGGEDGGARDGGTARPGEGASAPEAGAAAFPEAELTRDAFLGGRLRLLQPRRGYRAGIDPVLLAAAVPASPGEAVLELGCGAGVAVLCLGARVPGLRLAGVELQPAYADLARRNAALNALALEVVEADLRALPPDLRQRSFDHVLANPPYFDRRASTRAADPGRDMALGGDTPLADWIEAAARRLVPGGTLTLSLRIERLPETLAAIPPRLGSVSVLPLAARTGRAAHLFLLQAKKGGRAAFRLCAPLVLHAGPAHLRDGEDYAPEAARILRDASALSIGR